MGQQGKNFGEKWLEMALAVTLTDNGHSAYFQLTAPQLESVQRIAGRTLSQLESDGVFVFPGVKKSDLSPEDNAAKEYELGHHDDPRIFTLSRQQDAYQLHSNNLVGFVGCNDVEVTISSRFTSDQGSDFFLHYLMQKALRLTAIELPRSLSPKEQILRLLPLLFPAYLMRAFSQGIFKQYLRFTLKTFPQRRFIFSPQHEFFYHHIPFQCWMKSPIDNSHAATSDFFFYFICRQDRCG